MARKTADKPSDSAAAEAAAEQHAESDSAAEDNTRPEFLDEDTKNNATGGEGPQGRPLVFTSTGCRVPRAGDEVRPQCPNCTRDHVAVLCGAVGSPRAITNYRCPFVCGFSIQKVRPAGLGPPRVAAPDEGDSRNGEPAMVGQESSRRHFQRP